MPVVILKHCGYDSDDSYTGSDYAHGYVNLTLIGECVGIVCLSEVV